MLGTQGRGLDVPSVQNSVGVRSNRESPQEDGFTLVRRNGRRTEGQVNNVVFGAVGSGGGGANRNRAPMRKQDSLNLAITNSFGNLEESMASMDIREEVAMDKENKENEDPQVMGSNVRSKEKGRGTQSRNQMERGKMGVRENPKEKRVGSNRAENNVYGTRSRTGKVRRPTPGLVFGPTIGELALSPNGKRLRVEKESIGGAGGPSIHHGGDLLRKEEVSHGVPKVDVVLAQEGGDGNGILDIQQISPPTGEAATLMVDGGSK